MTLSLNVKKREVTGRGVKNLRKQNLIPAVIYGKDVPSLNLVVEYLPFNKLYKEAGESTLIDLKVDEAAPVKVLVQEVQADPRTGKLSHVDFRQIKMTEKIKVDAILKFVGEAPAVKETGGTFVHSMDEVEIECLPQDMLHEIEVDISGLKTFEDSIQVKDLKVPAGVKILADMNATLATVEAPLTEEEMKAELETPVAEKVEEVEVVEKEKKEGEEAAAPEAQGEKKE
ncbi:50S ribosomal protein L25 [Patescibacteria group bacterium]|nr:50S ribosomal protein L25 [Patescibacteria group bacterium]